MELREKAIEAAFTALCDAEGCSTQYHATVAADAILSLPEIKEALDWWQMNLEAQRQSLD